MRKERVASVLKREISRIVSQEMADPRLQFVTITEVKVSNDLKNAIVYFSSLGDKKEAFKILNKAKGYVRSMLAHRIRIKSMPALEFKVDKSFEQGQKINALFKEISKNNQEQ